MVDLPTDDLLKTFQRFLDCVYVGIRVSVLTTAFENCPDILKLKLGNVLEFVWNWTFLS